MPLARVARVLGHADTATTYKIYLHFFPDDFAADMDRLDEYLAPERAVTEDRWSSRGDVKGGQRRPVESSRRRSIEARLR